MLAKLCASPSSGLDVQFEQLQIHQNLSSECEHKNIRETQDESLGTSMRRCRWLGFFGHLLRKAFSTPS